MLAIALVTAVLAGAATKAHGARGGPTDADYQKHVEALERRTHRLPGQFTIVVQKPFVVVGDQSPETVRSFADGVLRWAIERLEAQYFARRPSRILDVWLFKDAASYVANAERLFGEKPESPYGYYSPADRALVMNIATGGGTLIHELVHPYVEASFPGAPAWFNEGMGSLFEQSSERSGEIVGLTNWRLGGLQRAILRGGLRSFRELCALGEDVFYGRGSADHYAQARYLLYYLQERGLLGKFYRTFHARRAVDPTGYQSLRAVLGLRTASSLRRFEAQWQRWVMTLRFG